MPKKAGVFAALLLSAVSAVSVSAESLNESAALMLVNTSHRIEKDYEPERTRIGDTYFYMNSEAAEALIKMLSDMEAELGEAPMIISTYRSYEKQETVFNADVEKAVKSGAEPEKAAQDTAVYIQLPGASEHQTALAVDLSNDGSLEEDFIETEAGKWLEENCHEYGFIIRYPKEKEEYTGIGYEPWHIRYVGHPFSDIMKENNWCLEEFIAYMKRNKMLVWEDSKNIWSLYFTAALDESYDTDTAAYDTNSGGYVITSKKKKDSVMNVADNGSRYKEKMHTRLVERLVGADSKRAEEAD